MIEYSNHTLLRRDFPSSSSEKSFPFNSRNFPRFVNPVFMQRCQDDRESIPILNVRFRSGVFEEIVRLHQRAGLILTAARFIIQKGSTVSGRKVLYCSLENFSLRRDPFSQIRSKMHRAGVLFCGEEKRRNLTQTLLNFSVKIFDFAETHDIVSDIFRHFG